MPQHHLEREKRPGDRCVERCRHRRRHRTAQQVTPGDAIGLDAVADPGCDHAGHVHHRPLSPAGATTAQGDDRRRDGCQPRPPLDPTFIKRRTLDHLGDGARPPIGGEMMQDQPHHQPAQDRHNQHPVPGQNFGRAVHMGHVAGAIGEPFQRRDSLAKQERGKPRRDADHQRYQPESNLAGPMRTKEFPPGAHRTHSGLVLNKQESAHGLFHLRKQCFLATAFPAPQHALVFDPERGKGFA